MLGARSPASVCSDGPTGDAAEAIGRGLCQALIRLGYAGATPRRVKGEALGVSRLAGEFLRAISGGQLASQMPGCKGFDLVTNEPDALGL